MSRVLSPLAWAFCLIAFVCLGCHSNPTTAETQLPKLPELSARSSAQTHHSLGFYSLVIDAESYEVKALPARSGDWHFNLTGVLNTTMGVSAAMVPGESDPPNGLFVLDITLTHPLPTKPQFSGFDVKGVLITPGSFTVGPLVFADLDETQLENTDGYTRWWNPTEFILPGMLGYTEGNLAIGPTSALTATVNPYKLFADVLAADDSVSPVSDEPLDSPAGRAVFTAGSGNTRRYRIRFPLSPGPQVVYGYAIDCAWNLPNPNPPTEVPDDFPMNANQPEPWRVDVFVTDSTLYYDTQAGKAGGILSLRINVWDWQGKANGNNADEVSVVRLFAPDLWDGGYNASFQMDTGNTARYTAHFPLGVALPTHAGETILICRVGSADGSTYQQGAAPAPDSPLSAYQVVVLDIPDPDCILDNNNNWAEAVEVNFVDSIDNQVCTPFDQSDYYSFEFLSGYHPFGEIRLYANANPTTIGLYDHTYHLLAESGLSNGLAVIELDDLPLMPTVNYIRVHTTNDVQVVPYRLELDADLNLINPVNPVEITPSELFCKPNRVYNAHSNWILTGDWGLWVYNLSVPSNPQQIYHETTGISTEASYFHPRLYYKDPSSIVESGISLIDFSNPEAPVHHERVISGLPLGVRGICQSSTHLYIGNPLAIGTDVIIYEFDTHTNLIEVGTIPDFGGPRFLDLMNPGGPNKKLIAATLYDIFAFDVDDPTAVTANGSYTQPPGLLKDMEVRSYRVFYTLYNSALQEGYLYALEHNMAIPDDFDEVGSILLPGEAEAMYGWSPNMFVADGTEGLTICDIDDPTLMTVESTSPLISEGVDVAVYGDLVCVVPQEAGMQVVDASIPDNPEIIARLQVVNSPRAALIKGDYMLVAESAGSQHAIKIVDISDPPNARLVNLRQMDDPPRGMHMDGNRMVVWTYDYCQLWDVTAPESPQYYSTVYPGHTITAIGLYGKVMYIGTQSSGLFVYDIADLHAPSHENTLALTNPVHDFTFHEEHMYLANMDGLYVFSIDTAVSPTYVGLYGTAIRAWESEVVTHYLYIVTGDTFEIADVTDPSSPSKLGDVLVNDVIELTEIAVEGQFAYIQGSGSPAYACRVWPPDNPSVYKQVYTQYFVAVGGVACDLLVRDSILYGMNRYTGIRIHGLY